MREIVASAPGKVNLILRSAVAGEDGYHQLFTVFEAVSLREYVVARTRRTPGIKVETLVYRPSTAGDPEFAPDLTAKLAELPTERHLAVRAAKALQPLAAASRWGATSSGLHLTVHKTIPMAGGMAGGSADAAAVLVAVSALWELPLGLVELQAVGRTIGADVPACLQGQISVGVGRGDHMTILSDEVSQRHWWALAFAADGLSTPAVFREFDRLRLGAEKLPSAIGEVLNTPEDLCGSVAALAPNLHNDLSRAAVSLRPQLAEVGRVAQGCGAEAWMVSGSGPTIAALTTSADEARAVCEGWKETPGVAGTAICSGPGNPAEVELALPEWTRLRR